LHALLARGMLVPTVGKRGKMDFSEDELEAMGNMSKYIASVVRNAMEDFHCENLSDDQMIFHRLC